MAFDWKQFGAAFLGEVTEGIQERGAEAKAYKVKQEEAAERNQSLINERSSRARQAAEYARQAKQLMGNRPDADQLVRTAMSSGMGTIQELYEKLNKAANEPGMNGRLGEDDIEAILGMSEIPAIDQSLMDMSLDDYAKRTYGAKLSTPVATQQDDTSMVGQLFGFGAKDRVKDQLAQQDFGGGMTVADINALSRQSEYQKLIPGATMVFAERNYFNSDLANDFAKRIVDRSEDALGTDYAKTYIQKARMDVSSKGGSAEQMDAAEQQAMKDMQVRAVLPYINSTADEYHKGGFFDNILATETIKNIMGPEYLDYLIETYDVQAPDSVDDDEPTTSETTTPKEIETPKEPEIPVVAGITARPSEGGQMREKREWDRKYKGKYDPDTGAAIIVEPRPGTSETRTERKISGREYEVNLYAEWNDKYGDTHNIDGTPKRVEG